MSPLIDERTPNGILSGRAAPVEAGARARVRALVALLVLLGVVALVVAALAATHGYVPDRRPPATRTQAAPGGAVDPC